MSSISLKPLEAAKVQLRSVAFFLDLRQSSNGDPIGFEVERSPSQHAERTTWFGYQEYGGVKSPASILGPPRAPMNAVKRTVETRVLDFYPDIRTAVLDSPAFEAWLMTLKQMEIDGETLYLRGGDMLRDRDQVIFEWARRNGMLNDETIERALKETEE
jgi:hypothetical protein